jgi:hypothetical protein
VKDLLFLLGTLGFAAFLGMMMMGIVGSSFKFWFDLLS